MKYILSLCILSVLLCGCRETPKVQPIPEKHAVTKGRYFFDFDEVVYYKTDLTINQYLEIYNKEHKTKGESQLLGLVAHKPLLDTLLITGADKAGFAMKKIPKEKYPAMKEIFRKNFGDYFETASTEVFGDIYIFRKKGKIIGTAKLCYECAQALFTGTDAKTEQFGRLNNEFEKLREIVK